MTSTDYRGAPFPLALTTDQSLATKKGAILFSITLVLFVLLLIALLRTVFMDPGFFESPTVYEQRLVLKNSFYKGKSKLTMKEVREDTKALLKGNIDEVDETNKYVFFNDFASMINNYPLTFQEYTMLNHNLDYYLGQKRLMSIINETKDKAKRLEKVRRELLEIPSDPKEAINPLNREDVYDNFIGTDLMRLPLCNSCLRWKTERSHHCRQCGKCILKMDHHCPWLANCIGFRNYKYFCLIHLYGMINSLLVAFTFWEAVYNHFNNFSFSFWEASFVIYVYICNLGLLAFLFWLFAFNWTLIFTGQTVIEQSDRERFPSSKPENIYDLGNYRNFTTVFGRNPLVWFIPFFANYEGEGLVYETNLAKH